MRTFATRTPFLAVVPAMCLIAGAAPAQSAVPQGCPPMPAAAKTINVKDTGARGDGRTDDTAAIQAAIDRLGERGGKVVVPAGTYMVNAEANKELTLKSRITLELAKDATLKAIPNGAESYTMLTLRDVSDVMIAGGRLLGERDQHTGQTGEWGMGIRITGRSSRITVQNITIANMWGDGIYVQGAKEVRLCSVVADNNRRQGMSVIEVDGMLVTNSIFKNTHGTRPSSGIDFEPNEKTQKIVNVRIENSKFLDNAGAGILIAGKRGEVSLVEIVRNTFKGVTPIDIEYSPGVRTSQICNNRHIMKPVEATAGIGGYAEPTPVLVVQNGCGDRRILKRKKKKK